jgi:hypothetical protein
MGRKKERVSGSGFLVSGFGLGAVVRLTMEE